VSPKNKEKIVRPTSPKEISNKNLAISAVVPSEVLVKPNNLAVSSVNQG
jgi:hypothetical protein